MQLRSAYVAGFGVVGTLVLLVAFAVLNRVLFGESVSADLKTGNLARRLYRVGQIAAVFMVSAAVVDGGLAEDGTAREVLHDAGWVGGFGLLGLVLVMVTGRLGLRLLLAARLPSELDRGNVAAGVAAAANYVASGLVAARAVGGRELRYLGVSVAFFLLAQLTVYLFSSLFRALTTYDDADQIAGENLAAGFSYAGVVVAVAIVVSDAVGGEFTGWASSISGYARALVALVALYPVRQIFVQGVLLRAPLRFRGGLLDREIGTERNVGLSVLEATAYVSTALVVARLA